jgi:hypothetical protein
VFGISRRATIRMVCIVGIWQIFEDRLHFGKYTAYPFWSQVKFERCVPSDIKIKRTRISCSRSIALPLNSTLLSSCISSYLFHQPPVHSVHCSTKACGLCIAVQATLRGVNEMFCVGWLQHQPSYGFDDVWTPLIDRVLVIVIPSHILESVYISKMYFCHLKPPGVSEKMWRVNLDASISGEYQTQ